ncbi:MAG: Uma2 family endonuclease [Chitinophagales bacterium]|nr:Uma2 family endonuclease [Hyphomicrobiales bacterium]
MNHFARPPKTTQAAEGFPRRPFTTDDLRRMVEVGIIGHEERIELIGGELKPMAAKGARHEMLKIALNRFWTKRLPENINLAQETGLYLGPNDYVEPDFIFYPRELRWNDLRGHNLLLCVEVADTSMAYDRGLKARIYASFGVPELWVMDATKLITHIHRDPVDSEYKDTSETDKNAFLTPLDLPELGVRLGELELI